MARPIDEKIVKMTLDNAKFKRNARDTLKSFQSISDGINSANNVDLSRIANGISSIQRRFSVVGAVVGSVIHNLTTSALEMGKNLYRSLVDPLVEGGKKRALNIEQAKFQFEGLGMDIEKTMESALAAVTGTAFGLDEAAVVASQFGATGMRAGKEMTGALRGISGVAAMTGSSYEEIGNIFTTVAGNGRLMGNDLLRLGSRGVNAAATLGKAMGKTETEIRSMVTKGQIDFNTFASAMDDAFGEHATKANDLYSGSLSNMKAALARIGADIYTKRFEKLRDIFNATTPKIDDLANAVKPLINALNTLTEKSANKLIKVIEKIDFKKFADLGGVANIVKSFWNVVWFGESIIKIVTNAWKRIFPPATAQTFVNMTQIVRDLTDRLRFSGETTEKLTRIMQGIFSVFSSVWIIVRELGIALFGLVPRNTEFGILDLTVKIADMATAFNESLKEGNWLTEMIQNLGVKLREFGEWMKHPIENTKKFARSLKEDMGESFEWLRKVSGPVIDFFKELSERMDGKKLTGAAIIGGLIYVAMKIRSFINNLKGGWSLGEAIRGFFGTITGAISNFTKSIRSGILLKIAAALGILAISLKLMESIEIGDLAKGLTALGTSMAILMAGLAVIDKLSLDGGFKSAAALIGIMTSVSATMLILAQVIKQLDSIDSGSMVKSISTIGIMLAELGLFLVLIKGAKITPSSILGIITLAASVKILSGALLDLKDLDIKQLITGLSGMAGLLGAILLFTNFSNSGQIMGSGVALTLMAGALNLMVIPLKQIASMEWEELGRGLAGMAGALIIAGGAGALFASSIGGAAGIALMAGALTLLSVPMKIFATMTWGEIGKGLAMVAGSLILIGVAGAVITPILPSLAGLGAVLILIGAGFLGMGGALALAGTALSLMASISVKAMSKVVESLEILLVGLMGLTDHMKELGIKIIDALIEVFTEKLPELISALIETVSHTLMEVRRSFADNAEEATALGFAVIIGIMKGLNDNAEELLDTAAELMITIIDGMANTIDEKRERIVDAVMRLFRAIILLAIDAGEKFNLALFGNIPGMEKVIKDSSARMRAQAEESFAIADIGEKHTDDYISTLTAKEQEYAKAGLLIGKSTYDAADSFDFNIISTKYGTQFTSGFNDKQDSAQTAGFDFAKSAETGGSKVDFLGIASGLVGDLTSTLSGSKGDTSKVAEDLLQTTKKGAGKVDFSSVSSDNIIDMVNSMDKGKNRMDKAGVRATKAGQSGAKDSKGWSAIGGNAATSFAGGMGSSEWKIRDKAKSMAQTAMSTVSRWLQIRSPSKVMNRIGQFFGDGFGGGIVDRIKSVSSKAKDMAVSATNALRNSLEDVTPEDEEFRIKVVIDDNEVDWDDLDDYRVRIRKPDPIDTRNLLQSTHAAFRQNDNNLSKDGDTKYEYNNEYNVVVHSNSKMSRSEAREMAVVIQSELKDIDDKNNRGIGEEVVF